MNSRSCRFRLVTLAITTSAFSICAFLAYLFISDNAAHPLDRPAFIQGQSQATTYKTQHVSTIQFSDSPAPLNGSAHSDLHTLGIASQVFVLSLSRRVDRRKTMDALSHALHFEFVYVDGVEATDARIDRVLRVLRIERHTFKQNSSGKTMDPNALTLHVPEYEYIAGEEWQAGASEGSDSMGSDDGAQLSFMSVDTQAASAPVLSEGTFEYGETLDLPCATPEDPFPAPLNAAELHLLPPWRVLSRGMVACWIGHLNIIRQILKLQLEVAVVLEDDVDIEYDISKRLTDMWPALPRDGWDIVMLGHCHSNESIHPPLYGAASLRPSSAPKCTHAYAISLPGARRLTRILSAPGFAFSRALDQALSWLINTGKIRSYSVVPPIVVQTKHTVSDIWRHLPAEQPEPELDQPDVQRQSGVDGSDKGSNWRDVLMDSTLERLGMMGT